MTQKKNKFRKTFFGQVQLYPVTQNSFFGQSSNKPVTQISLEKLSLVKVQLPVTQMSLEKLSLGKVQLHPVTQNSLENLFWNFF